MIKLSSLNSDNSSIEIDIEKKSCGITLYFGTQDKIGNCRRTIRPIKELEKYFTVNILMQKYTIDCLYGLLDSENIVSELLELEKKHNFFLIEYSRSTITYENTPIKISEQVKILRDVDLKKKRIDSFFSSLFQGRIKNLRDKSILKDYKLDVTYNILQKIECGFENYDENIKNEILKYIVPSRFSYLSYSAKQKIKNLSDIEFYKKLGVNDTELEPIYEKFKVLKIFKEVGNNETV